MVKHPKKVTGYDGSLKELAEAVGNMTYDQTALFIEELAKDLKRQGEGDLKRGRKKLAQSLFETSEKLIQAKKEMDEAWKICELFM